MTSLPLSMLLCYCSEILQRLQESLHGNTGGRGGRERGVSGGRFLLPTELDGLSVEFLPLRLLGKLDSIIHFIN